MNKYSKLDANDVSQLICGNARLSSRPSAIKQHKYSAIYQFAVWARESVRKTIKDEEWALPRYICL